MGFTDLSRLNGRARARPGQFGLPDKELRSVLLLSACAEGPVISAGLCMSPCSSDYIFIPASRDARRIVSEDPECSEPLESPKKIALPFC